MENNKLGQDPAFPAESEQIIIGNESYTFTNENGNTEIGYKNLYGVKLNKGISKRFYVACIAMQGLIQHNGISNTPSAKENNIKILITDAYNIADELLRQENL